MVLFHLEKSCKLQNKKFTLLGLKVVSATILLICFESLKESTCEKKDNQILTFQIINCHYVIECPSMKHETHFTE